MSVSLTMTHDQLLDAARSGDQQAYADLVAPHRAELHAHCYRMLGSTVEADDALQEVLTRAWRGLRGFEGRSSIRTWLFRIATNACLKMLQRRPSRVLPVDFGPSGDPHDFNEVPEAETVWIEPYHTTESRYEMLESVELAFVAALQHVPPAQRAVLILRDVLGYSASETAGILGTSAISVNSSLQRARHTVQERVQRRNPSGRTSPSQQAEIRALGDDGLRAVVDRYVDAWKRGDVQAIVAMLTEDAALTMPPYAMWLRGPDAVGEFLAERPMAEDHRWRLVPTTANGQLAFRGDLWDDGKSDFVPHTLSVITLRGGRISEITAFLDLDLTAWL